ncbi:MAG: cytochrome c1 [Proteobacteria bacterium]|nr:cytochrome c1 [Pseudomonadota bacterium]
MKAIKASIGLILVALLNLAHASEAGVHLDKVKNNLCDKASLQRGASLYMNYCAGCHSLQYVRFKDLAKDLGIVDKKGNVLEKLVNDNLNFIGDKVTAPILVATPQEEAMKWFGVAPPDLSLVGRSRGKDWLYTYLRTFYVDPKRPWGVNNLTFPDVGMPHILLRLQGEQVPVYETQTMEDEEGKPYQKQVISHLELKTPGLLSKEEYDKAMTDLVNFLDYVGEPHKLERKRLGVWVLLFLVVFTLFAYLLKREYWKDVH